MKVTLRVLNDREIEIIHAAAIHLLEGTGSIVENAEAAALLQRAGARVEGQNRVYIPSRLVEQALASAPSSVTIYDRLGNESMVLGGEDSFFGAHVSCPMTLDQFTGEPRPITLADIGKAARVVDALPNIDYLTVVAAASDVSQPHADAAAFAVALENTSKPITMDLLSLETARWILAMAAVRAPAPLAIPAQPNS